MACDIRPCIWSLMSHAVIVPNMMSYFGPTGVFPVSSQFIVRLLDEKLCAESCRVIINDLCP